MIRTLRVGLSLACWTVIVGTVGCAKSTQSEVADGVIQVRPSMTGEASDVSGAATDVPSFAQAPVVGISDYPRDSLEERLDIVDHVIRVSGGAKGVGRFNTASGQQPAGSLNADEPGWIRYRPITFTVTAVYKTTAPGLATFYSYDWPHEDALAGFMLSEQYGFESDSEGILLVTDFPAEAETPLVDYLDGLVSAAPATLLPAADGAIHDWFPLASGATRSTLFHDETYLVEDLLQRIEAHLGPP